MAVQKQYNIADFSPHLFWDVDRSKLDWEANKRLVVERVIQRGSRSDFDLLFAAYSKEQVKEVVKELPWLDDRDTAFVHALFDIPYAELKCYARRQLSRHY